MTKIPIFIIVHNQYEVLKKTVESYEKYIKTPIEIKRTALIIISKALYNEDFIESSLYSSNYETRFKKVKRYKDFINE